MLIDNIVPIVKPFGMNVLIWGNIIEMLIALFVPQSEYCDFNQYLK